MVSSPHLLLLPTATASLPLQLCRRSPQSPLSPGQRNPRTGVMGVRANPSAAMAPPTSANEGSNSWYSMLSGRLMW